MKAGRYYILSTEYLWSTYGVHATYIVAVLLSGSKNQPRLCDSVQLGSGTPCRPGRQASCSMRPGRLCYTEYSIVTLPMFAIGLPAVPCNTASRAGNNQSRML